MEKNSNHQGLRFNNGKLRYDLVQPWAHEQMVKILTKGSIKYESRNWEKGMAWSNIISSLKRHLAAIENGEDFDNETLELHAAHLACNAHFLTAYYKIYPEGDDRPHQYLNPRRISVDIDDCLADWVTEWCNYHKCTLPDHWEFDRDIHNKIMEMPETFWLNLSCKIQAKDLPFIPTCYITARSIPQEWTQKWLDLNSFPHVPLYSVGHGESKLEVAKEEQIDYHIDDNYNTFIEFNNNGICCFLMDALHNQRWNIGYKRIKSFEDFKNRFL